MSERRWDLMVLKDFSTLEGSQPNAAGWVPSGLPLHTDAEVLAEMTTEALVDEIERRQGLPEIEDYILLDEVQRRGYGIIYGAREDPNFDMEHGDAEALTELPMEAILKELRQRGVISISVAAGVKEAD